MSFLTHRPVVVCYDLALHKAWTAGVHAAARVHYAGQQRGWDVPEPEIPTQSEPLVLGHGPRNGKCLPSSGEKSFVRNIAFRVEGEACFNSQ